VDEVLILVCKISQAMQEFEEKRMLAIRKEENSRTEMMVQRMRYVKLMLLWKWGSKNMKEFRKMAK